MTPLQPTRHHHHIYGSRYPYYHDRHYLVCDYGNDLAGPSCYLKDDHHHHDHKDDIYFDLNPTTADCYYDDDACTDDHHAI